MSPRFDPIGFLGTARLLARPQTDGHDSAARCRSAISRAYYAAFNVAAEALRQRGCAIPQDAHAHGDVCDLLLRAGVRELTVAARVLGRLRISRNQADYVLDAESAGTSESAEAAIEDAEEAIEYVVERVLHIRDERMEALRKECQRREQHRALKVEDGV